MSFLKEYVFYFLFIVQSFTVDSAAMTVSQEMVKQAYSWLFGSLVLLTYTIVPFAYFYGSEKEATESSDFEEDREPIGVVCTAIRRTAIFVVVVLGVFGIGLVYSRKSEAANGGSSYHSPKFELGKEVAWVREVIDFDNHGDGAILFGAALLTIMGSMLLAIGLGYGLAVTPFRLLKGNVDLSTQRTIVEGELVRMRRDIGELKRKGSSLGWRENKKLEEMQQNLRVLSIQRQRFEKEELGLAASSSLIKGGLGLFIVAPVRMFLAVLTVVVSLVVGGPLTLSVSKQLIFSVLPSFLVGNGNQPVLKLESASNLNVIDNSLSSLASHFPMDFIVLGVLVLVLFGETLIGLSRFNIFELVLWCFKASGGGDESMPSNHQSSTANHKLSGSASSYHSGSVNKLNDSKYKSQPSSKGLSPFKLLCLAMAMSQATVALCPLLLSIAPSYTAWGSQANNGANVCLGNKMNSNVNDAENNNSNNEINSKVATIDEVSSQNDSVQSNTLPDDGRRPPKHIDVSNEEVVNNNKGTKQSLSDIFSFSSKTNKDSKLKTSNSVDDVTGKSISRIENPFSVSSDYHDTDSTGFNNDIFAKMNAHWGSQINSNGDDSFMLNEVPPFNNHPRRLHQQQPENPATKINNDGDSSCTATSSVLSTFFKRLETLSFFSFMKLICHSILALTWMVVTVRRALFKGSDGYENLINDLIRGKGMHELEFDEEEVGLVRNNEDEEEMF